MPDRTTDTVVEPIGGFPQGAGKRGGHIRSGAKQAEALATYERPRRGAEPKSARSRMAEPTKKRTRDVAVGPTPHRIAKGDLVRNRSGALVVEDGLEKLRRGAGKINEAIASDPTKANDILKRLHHRCSLASDPGMSEQMYEVGRRYQEVVHRAGLTGIAAQNLLGVGGGSGCPLWAMPANDFILDVRKKLQKAWDILPDEAIRAMHGMLIEGRDAESVGRQASTYTQTKECRVAGITLLRIALSMLVAAKWA